MARRDRILIPGATYHIISRTLDQRPVFADEAIIAGFEQSLLEICSAHRWRLYAYTLLPDTAHMLVKTEEADLPRGMKWLMNQVAARYNRLQQRSGPVFAGRYKSILVEDEPESMLGLTHFIHAAPVRRGIIEADKLQDRPWSSLYHYAMNKPPDVMDRNWLFDLIGEARSRSGLRTYLDHLVNAPEALPKNEPDLQARYCRGWFIGAPETKLRYARKLAGIDPEAMWVGSDLKDLNEAKWQRVLDEEFKRLGVTKQRIQTDRKGAPWKMDLARMLRRETSASNIWIARKLNMGHPNRVSMALHEAKKESSGEAQT